MIKEWREKRKQAYLDKAYRKGFQWAMAEFYLDHTTVEAMEDWLEFSDNICSPFHTSPTDLSDQFNRGARYAFHIIKLNEGK